jgi:hypothetical protein
LGQRRRDRKQEATSTGNDYPTPDSDSLARRKSLRAAHCENTRQVPNRNWQCTINFLCRNYLGRGAVDTGITTGVVGLTDQ